MGIVSRRGEDNPIEQIALCNGIDIPKFQNCWFEDIDGAQEMLMNSENVQRRCYTFETRMNYVTDLKIYWGICAIYYKIGEGKCLRKTNYQSI